MPSQRLNDTLAPVKKFDILAMSDEVKDGLMLHAALSNVTMEATNSCKIKTIHMGPPFGRKTAEFDAVGSCELTEKQAARIEEFIDRQWAARKAERERLSKLGLPQNPIAQYRIQPPHSRPRKGSALTRYSCVGFVLLAYKRARIELLSGPSPLKTVEELKDLYPPFFHPILDDEDKRKDFGLREGDRWPVVLAGYILHATNRPLDQVNGTNATPYQPQEGDEYFPRQAPETPENAAASA